MYRHRVRQVLRLWTPRRPIMTHRPSHWFGLASLGVAAGFAIWPPNSVTMLLALVLAGCATRFLTLPCTAVAPDRRTGRLLVVPLAVGLLLLFIDEASGRKASDANVSQVSGWLLLSVWLGLVSFEHWWWHRRPRGRVPHTPSA